MSLLINRSFLKVSSPLIQANRLRSKINIQRPRAPHFEKALYLNITKPRLLSPYVNRLPAELCDKDFDPYKKDIDNPLQRIIAGEVYDLFKSSRLIAFFHWNSMSTYKQFKAFAMYKKHNMFFKNYGRITMEMALKGTPYEAALELFVSRNIIVFSPEPDIKTLLKIAKKFREIILLAAIYDGKFICKDDIMKYSLIPNIQAAQLSLLQTLNSIGGQLVGQLTTHQNTLVNNLQSRIKQLEEN